MILLSMFGHQQVGNALCHDLNAKFGTIESRVFPDGETYLNCLDDYKGKKVIILDSLDHPHDKILPLIWLSETVRDLGATQVGLVSPYLCYMRQDKRFKPGEALTSSYFAKLMSGFIDWLVTVDPHLHRIKHLSEIYTVPTKVLHAAGTVSRWIKANIKNPCLIGPDAESEQWVSAMANEINCPYYVLTKNRLGDHEVDISLPSGFKLEQRTPVLVDDMISSAGTMVTATELLKAFSNVRPYCIAIHGVFSKSAYDKLKACGVEDIITTNTIIHPTNQIDLTGLLGSGIKEFI